MTEKYFENFKVFHLKHFGAQDQASKNLKERYLEKSENYITEKLNCIYDSNNYNRYTNTIPFIVKEDAKWGFKNIVIKVRNPNKTNINEIFKDISFKVGGSYFDKIYNLDTYLNTFSQLFNIKDTIYGDEYTFIHLPHLINQNLIYNFPWQHIEIICTPNNNKQVNYNDIEFFADKYILSNVKESEVLFYQCQYNGHLLYNNSRLIDIIPLNFDHPIYAIIIDTDSVEDIEDIERIILQINSIDVIDISIKQLEDINKELGYKFKKPTILLSQTFCGYSETTINFSKVNSAKLLIKYTKIKHTPNIFDIYAINANINKITRDMIGVKFSKI